MTNMQLLYPHIYVENVHQSRIEFLQDKHIYLENSTELLVMCRIQYLLAAVFTIYKTSGCF